MIKNTEDTFMEISKIKITRKKMLIVVILTIVFFVVSIFTAYRSGETKEGIQGLWHSISRLTGNVTVIITTISVFVWSIKKGFKKQN